MALTGHLPVLWSYWITESGTICLLLFMWKRNNISEQVSNCVVIILMFCSMQRKKNINYRNTAKTYSYSGKWFQCALQNSHLFSGAYTWQYVQQYFASPSFFIHAQYINRIQCHAQYFKWDAVTLKLLGMSRFTERAEGLKSSSICQQMRLSRVMHQTYTCICLQKFFGFFGGFVFSPLIYRLILDWLVA